MTADVVVNAEVDWDSVAGTPTVATIVVPPNTKTATIVWNCGPDVVNFSITGLDPNVFDPKQSGANVTTFQTTDKNGRKAIYSYTVTATHVSGVTASHDPKIENGG